MAAHAIFFTRRLKNRWMTIGAAIAAVPKRRRGLRKAITGTPISRTWRPFPTRTGQRN
jgi:hypothetical protein